MCRWCVAARAVHGVRYSKSAPITTFVTGAVNVSSDFRSDPLESHSDTDDERVAPVQAADAIPVDFRVAERVEQWIRGRLGTKQAGRNLSARIIIARAIQPN